jgi:hypothetical protein
MCALDLVIFNDGPTDGLQVGSLHAPEAFFVNNFATEADTEKPNTSPESCRRNVSNASNGKSVSSSVAENRIGNRIARPSRSRLPFVASVKTTFVA